MRISGTLLVVALLFPFAAAGQTLQTGTWTGTVTPPGGQPMDLPFLLSQVGDSVGIRVSTPDGGFLDAQRVRVVNGKLTFHWNPEPDTNLDIFCELSRRPDASWTGPCTGSDGTTGSVTLTPPKRPGAPPY